MGVPLVGMKRGPVPLVLRLGIERLARLLGFLLDVGAAHLLGVGVHLGPLGGCLVLCVRACVRACVCQAKVVRRAYERRGDVVCLAVRGDSCNLMLASCFGVRACFWLCERTHGPLA